MDGCDGSGKIIAAYEILSGLAVSMPPAEKRNWKTCRLRARKAPEQLSR
jgi:hypothetical protein